MPSPSRAAIPRPWSPRRAVWVILAVVCLMAAAAWPAASSAAPTGPEDPARGVQFDGLEADPSCPDGLLVQVPRGPDACTHGPDPAPTGEDVRERRSVAELRADERADQLDSAREPADCIGDGSSGSRVELIYARASDRADRYAQVVSLIQSAAGDMADRVKQSAAESGGYRTVRFVTESCNVVVRNVVLSTTGDDTLGRTASELAAKGFNRADRKYVTFVDANVYCGIAYMPGNVARVDQACWGGGTALHELMHNLSAVDDSAPNSSLGGHCTDESDRMCYSDEPHHPQMRQVCPTAHEALLDCNGDDYFNTAPRGGSFLSANTALNTADSTFLADRDGQLPVFLPSTPSGYEGPRYTVRADNADDDLCVYAIRPTTSARVRLFCVGYLGIREADVTGALISVAAGAGSVDLRLVATDRGSTRTFGFRVRRTGDATPLLDERDGVAGQQSSGAPLGQPDPVTGYPVFYDRTISLRLTNNRLPSASYSFAPASPRAGEAVTFTASASDPDGSIAALEWDLNGDGGYADAQGASASRVFDAPGTYRVGLRATDDAGGSTTSIAEVSVASAPAPAGGSGPDASTQTGIGPAGAGTASGPAGAGTASGPAGAGTASGESAICRATRTSLARERAALARLTRSLTAQSRSLGALKKRLKRGGLTKGERRRYAAAAQRLKRRQKERRGLAASVKRFEGLVVSRCGG